MGLSKRSGSFRNRGTLIGVLMTRILLFRVLYYNIRVPWSMGLKKLELWGYLGFRDFGVPGLAVSRGWGVQGF